MELKSQKKEAFANESKFLEDMRAKLADGSMDDAALREAYEELCNEYERLLDETKFLTKVSDKLEAKLNTTNEKLRKYNDELSKETEIAKSQKDKILNKNKQLYQEKSELDFRMNRFQTTLIVLIVLLVVACLTLVYWAFIKDNLPSTRH